MISIFKKKPKTGYTRSFAKRLTWRIMLRMLIIMGIPTFLVFWMGYGIVYTGATIVSNRIVKGEYEEIRRITSDLYVASVNNAPVIEDCLDQPDKLVGIMERMLKNNPYMRSCGLSFVENYYPQKGRWFCPFAVRVDSATIETHVLGDAKQDYLKEAWFKQALARNEGSWGRGYIDTINHDTPMISYTLPIHDKRDSTVAILGVDLSLEWLNDKVQLNNRSRRKIDNDSTGVHADKEEKWTANYSVYYFMVDSTGTFLLHPDQNRLLKEKLQTHVGEDPDSTAKDNLGLHTGDDDEFMLDGEKAYISYKPVKYTDWSLALVIPSLIVEIFGYLIGGFMILMILFGLLVVYFFGRRVIKKASQPLKQLAESANEVAKGNFTTQLPPLKSHDEIHLLRDSFEQMQLSLTSYVEELKTTTSQKASIESELKIAHGIQMAMLPKIFPPYPERSDIDIFGQLTPAKAVGGDLFDFYIHDEKLFFCIGDVSGKGVPASLVMAVTRSLFRNVSAHESEPHLIARALNDSLSEGNEMNMFVTLFVGVLDLATGHLDYCNAGHDSPLLIGQGVAPLPCDPNLPVGVMPDWQFTLQQVTLAPQTTIFLYTDGLNEAENILHAQFGDDRIISLAETLLNRGQNKPSTIIQLMTDAVHDFVGQAEQSDDLTMLAIQYKR
ncbi:MAG: SpoIIE family protein phosphatase [Prevotella sp.]|nr:SpoIIE family protein phosphatase [Prevotella sp.]